MYYKIFHSGIYKKNLLYIFSWLQNVDHDYYWYSFWSSCIIFIIKLLVCIVKCYKLLQLRSLNKFWRHNSWWGWILRSNRKLRNYMYIYAPAFFHFQIQGDLLLSADTQGHVYFWNARTGQSEAAIQAHDAAVNKIAFHKGRFFTAAS